MTLSQTPRKLREARFFFEKLRATAKPKAFNIHHPSHLALNLTVNAGKDAKLRVNTEEFGFYLSAFLSAARSVTFVLQNEDRKTYDEFFPTWLDALDPEDRELLDKMNDQRVHEVHRLGATVTLEEKVIPIYDVHETSSGRVAVSTSARRTPRSTITVPAWRLTISGRPSELVDICSRYLELLKDLIEKFPRS
ncbi:MAG: hypothetical protein ACLQAT_23865 [Candidatus Binataceae bacterium]